MTEIITYRKLVMSLEEATELVAKFLSISIRSTMKKTPNGKYIVTFSI